MKIMDNFEELRPEIWRSLMPLKRAGKGKLDFNALYTPCLVQFNRFEEMFRKVGDEI